MSDQSYLSMSDEEILNAPIPDAVIPQEEDEDSKKGEDNTATQEEGTDVNLEASGETVESQETTEQSTKASEEGESQTQEEQVEENQEEGEATPAQTTSEEVDYKAVYERITSPFKANGKEIRVKDVEDAISLMQMGANYNKKMAALKPNLKLMKLLESNGLLNEEKISYLIDLHSKNPAAIGKLIKDSGIDPLEIDATKADGYRPAPRTVDDREIELDQVLDEIQDSPTYNRTLEVVAHQWDNTSKQIISNSPQLLKVINAHMESGIYDLIQQELEQERMFGRLNGLSDIEAYRKVGDAIQARGGFNHIGRNVNTAPSQPKVIQPKPAQVPDQKIKDRKRAASPTTAAPVTQQPAFNPLALSDDEFNKLVKTNYL